jgi:C4-type Zn-finger protein
MTRGDHYNINCPYCSKKNTYASQGVSVPFRSVVYFTKECYHCKKNIKYRASWEIALQAERFPIIEMQVPDIQ